VLQDETAYSAAWRHYRRWSRAFWIVFVFFLPVFALLGSLRSIRDNGAVIFGGALLWMLAFALIGYQKSSFLCPRCGELFFRKFDNRRWRMDWQHNPFARRCMHCNLRKWANNGYEEFSEQV
jgi:hypothetical protein